MHRPTLTHPSRIFVILGVLLAVALPSYGAGEPAPSDPRIAEGVALHDRGQYEQALAKYRAVLASDPANVEALHEMAYSYLAKGDLPAALEVASRGVAIDGPLRPGFFMLIGNAHDQAGRPTEAIAAYESGIRENPSISLLHFNLGLALMGQGAWKKARASLERDISLRPDHASGHYYLAQVYERESFKVPALLATVRFLLLEPQTARAKLAAQRVDDLFALGYTKDAGTGNVTLTLGKDSLKEEGDFDADELGMLSAQAVAESEGIPKKAGEPFKAIARLKDTLAIVSEVPEAPSKGFAATYYVPYFMAMHKRGYVEVASHLALQAQDFPGSAEWLRTHKSQVSAFEAWSKTFQWAAPASAP